MNSRAISFMTGVVLLSIVTLLGMRVYTWMSPPVQHHFISPNDVRGSALIHKNQPYTLNFIQQNTLIDSLNQADAITRALTDQERSASDIDKIVIYLFRGEPIEIYPVGRSDENLVFSVPSWSNNNFWQEISNGELKTVLSNAYDP